MGSRIDNMNPDSPPGAPARRRWLSFVCLLGVATLAVSLAGSGWMMRSNAGPNAGAAPSSGETPSAQLYSIGHVDVENGVSYPYPALPGRVEQVMVREGQTVSKGYVLFRMDDRTQQEDLKRAENALAAAQVNVDKAANAQKKHDESVHAQEQAVESARSDLDAARIIHDRKKNLLKGNNTVKEEVDAAEKLVDKADAAVKAEQFKLSALKLGANDIVLESKSAAFDVTEKTRLLNKAKLALDECVVKAPADGTVLRLDVRQGDLLGAQPKSPPLIFCPDEPRIVRAEVEQEWADRVQEGQIATIQDETGNGSGPTWTGKVQRLSDWMAHRRSILPDPSQFHDVRTLECIIAIDPNQKPLRIGQRVRVAFSNP
jgi:HlyD family secretion protein